MTGGYAYRGSIPELQGHYFFADFVTNRLWSFKFNGDSQVDFDGTNFTDFTDWSERGSSISNVSSFGEDSNGDLIVVSLDGLVFRLSSANLLGDVTLDGAVDFLDIGPFIALLSANAFQDEADINLDGDVDFLDIGPFIELLSAP